MTVLPQLGRERSQVHPLGRDERIEHGWAKVEGTLQPLLDLAELGRRELKHPDAPGEIRIDVVERILDGLQRLELLDQLAEDRIHRCIVGPVHGDGENLHSAFRLLQLLNGLRRGMILWHEPQHVGIHAYACRQPSSQGTGQDDP